jgi:hypothetical protein
MTDEVGDVKSRRDRLIPPNRASGTGGEMPLGLGALADGGRSRWSAPRRHGAR